MECRLLFHREEKCATQHCEFKYGSLKCRLCCGVLLNFFPVYCPSRQMMERMLHSVRRWSSVWEQPREETERKRDFVERPERLLTCEEAWYSTACVSHTDLYTVCEHNTYCVCVGFLWGGGEGVSGHKISLPSAVLWLSFGPSLCPVFLPAPSS